VGAQRDQVDEVRADVPDDDPIDRALLDGDRARRGDPWAAHDVGFVSNGPMVRVVDVRRALAARGWTADGRLVIDVDGEALALEVAGGSAAVAPSGAAPDLSLDRASLASIAFGGVGVAQALRMGWAAARDDSTAARAAALFALPPYFSFDAF
jgi:predicted acetyltransferase